MANGVNGSVYAVFGAGLDLKERMERRPQQFDTDEEQSPRLAAEQSHLMEICRRVADVQQERSRGDTGFLGVHYCIVCWLDEIFIEHSPCRDWWNHNKLETQQFDTNDRAWKFWDQAKLAENRVSTEALEIFFLGAMLGFRGDWETELPKLAKWQSSTRSLLFSQHQRRWPAPPEIIPQTHVPRLNAAGRKQVMIRAWAVSVLALIPIAVMLLMSR